MELIAFPLVITTVSTSAVTVRLKKNEYQVDEDHGRFKVCAIMDGESEQEVVVQLFSVDETAIGKLHTAYTLKYVVSRVCLYWMHAYHKYICVLHTYRL